MPDSVHGEQSATHGPTTNNAAWNRRIRSIGSTATDSRLLWTLGLAVVLGDLLTTVYGLSVGLREQNPFVVATMARYGVAGLVGLKLFAVGWVAVIWIGLGRRYGIAAMLGLMLPQTIAVGINVATIATV